MLRAVIFDFDGVITDSEILHFRAFNEVLGEFGCELTTKDYYEKYLGLNDVDCYKLLIQQGRLDASLEQIPEMVEKKTGIFERLSSEEGEIIEGVREFLGMLKENDVPMAICSGALRHEIEGILVKAKLRGLFEVIVSAEDVSIGKPDPEGFLLALAQLNEKLGSEIKSEHCVVVEDSHWGLEAAKAAGMRVVGVTNTYGAEQLSKADRIVERLSELTMADIEQICG